MSSCRIVTCRSCGGSDLPVILSLGAMPLANALLTPNELDRVEPRFPLELALCRTCSLLQITETVPPETLFREYLYFSSFSDTMVRHAAALATELVASRSLDSRSLVVEIGSNDGYLLQHFAAAGVPVLGVEPARNVALAAEARGIRTVAEFFDARLAATLASAGEMADVIVANNVMAHVPDIHGIVGAIKTLLKSDGVFVMETPYVKDMLDKLEFDTIYHEHLFYYSLTALDDLLRRNGLAAAAVEHLPVHGGSLRVTAVHAGREGLRPSVTRLLEEEAAWQVRGEACYRAFAGRVDGLGRDLRALLVNLTASGHRVAGYGAAAKATTLLNFFDIDHRLIDFVADRSTYKQGNYIPGVRVPIRPVETLVEEMPDYVVLLAWNLADEIIEQQRGYRERGGRFIVPIPRVMVVPPLESAITTPVCQA